MATQPIRMSLVTNWWALAIRGIAAILFGIAAFLVPGITFAALVLLFGAFAFVDGIFAIAAGVRSGRRHEQWLPMILLGIVGVLAGIYTTIWPIVTALALVYVIASWAVVAGILEIIAAIRLRKKITHEWLLALAGVASIAFGVLLFLAPASGAVVLVWWVGAYALVAGALLLALAFRIRRVDREVLSYPERLAA